MRIGVGEVVERGEMAAERGGRGGVEVEERICLDVEDGEGGWR